MEIGIDLTQGVIGMYRAHGSPPEDRIFTVSGV